MYLEILYIGNLSKNKKDRLNFTAKRC